MTDAVASMISSPLFPFEGDVRLKALGLLLDAEIPRAGEVDRPCPRCADLAKGLIWADGSAHLHLWFVARPARGLELYGWGNVLWSQLLPPLDEVEIDNNLRLVRDALLVHNPA